GDARQPAFARDGGEYHPRDLLLWHSASRVPCASRTGRSRRDHRVTAGRFARQKQPHWAAAELAHPPPGPVPHAWDGQWRTGAAFGRSTFHRAARLTSKYLSRLLSDLLSPVRVKR